MQLNVIFAASFLQPIKVATLMTHINPGQKSRPMNRTMKGLRRKDRCYEMLLPVS